MANLPIARFLTGIPAFFRAAAAPEFVGVIIRDRGCFFDSFSYERESMTARYFRLRR